jgi:hypothetical protein
MKSAPILVETYIRAKDENRPYLMESAFAADAVLEMVVNSGVISFPPVSNGIHSISNVLVRQFAQTFENVHTFCLTPPPQDEEDKFSCDWLVGMSEKESRSVRVGCGRYDWLFQQQAPHMVEKLTITIDVMQSLAPISLASVMHWLSHLPYPWCPAQNALSDAPALDELQPIRQYLARVSA